MSRPKEELVIALLRSAYGKACYANSAVGWRQALKLSILTRTRDFGRPLSSSRGYATKRTATGAGPEARQQIAVLGGGITGLTAAHYLARHATDAHITIYEASDRLGGWIDGKNIDVKQGKVLVQRGPRMLRSGANSNKYDDLVLYDVLANLGLQDKIMSPGGAASSRYIYYPDHLVKLPATKLSLDNIVATIYSFLTEPLWSGVIPAMWHQSNYLQDRGARQALGVDEASTKNRRFAFDRDESVGDFLNRLMGISKDQLARKPRSDPVGNIVSAMFHGIYGGDVYKLSAKHSVLERFWYSTHLRLPNNHVWMAKKDWYLLCDMLDGPNSREVVEMAENAIKNELLVFEDGLLTLLEGLKADLELISNVTVKYNAPVTSLAKEGDGVRVSSGDKDQVKYNQVLSTLFSGHLAQIAQPANCLPSLAETHAVTIMVVNLWYPNSNLLKIEPSFGYLIPQTVPPDQNPECALGVLFDSDVNVASNEAPGTKLTVMLGGHHWDDWPLYPSAEMGEQMARAVVERHLGISAEEPVVASSKLCTQCLPQHTVGHRERMQKAHMDLMTAFGGKLMVAGPSYTSVGIIPAMRAGFDAAMRITRGSGPPWVKAEEERIWKGTRQYFSEQNEPIMDHVGSTGLQWADENEFDTMMVQAKQNMGLKKWSAKAHDSPTDKAASENESKE